jgi:YfiH family protein
MIRVGAGVVFTTASDGDMRHDRAARAGLGVPAGWATVRQVHGSTVVPVATAGDHGDADGMTTSSVELPLAVFTADCLGMVLHGPSSVAVVHAGWKGLDAGVVESAVGALGEVTTAAIGPHIRSCCFEVGPEVADRFPAHLARTTWGTTSVDLTAAAIARLPVEPEVVDMCTRCGPDAFSHRRDATTSRMAAVGWVT